MTTAKVIYNIPHAGLTIECSACNARLLYGAGPNFCAWCGSKFDERDLSDVKVKYAPNSLQSVAAEKEDA